MADLSDVSAYIAQAATAAVYPGGSTIPGIAGPDVAVRLFEGWPQEKSLDADLTGGNVQVSIYPMRGGSSVAQILPRQVVMTPPDHGMQAIVDDDIVLIAGAPSQGEYLTLAVDGAHAYTAAGASVGQILAAIAAKAVTDYPSVTAADDTIAFPGSHFIEARSGAPCVVGIVTHKQNALIDVTIWAPTPSLRDVISAAIQTALAAKPRVTLADGSQAIVRISATYPSDERVNAAIYRRDVVVAVEYATLDVYQAFEITTFGPTLDAQTVLGAPVGEITSLLQGSGS